VRSQLIVPVLAMLCLQAMSYAADYLTAIGLPEAIGAAPSLELLQNIYVKHCESLAFCTTRLLTGEPLSQEPAVALQVLALDKRGGVCCELLSPALCALALHRNEVAVLFFVLDCNAVDAVQYVTVTMCTHSDNELIAGMLLHCCYCCCYTALNRRALCFSQHSTARDRL
jgi:hypothetical protein